MLVYSLPTGYRVRTSRMFDKTEFATTNRRGETISVVYLPADEAATMHANLRRAAK